MRNRKGCALAEEDLDSEALSMRLSFVPEADSCHWIIVNCCVIHVI